ncbi:MAG: hypothetical protein JAY73_09190, partial [Candidatus Thiodiazotropha taylori]|nr:hypothetical protein [Candidatus Thiodiazotropha taylori]
MIVNVIARVSPNQLQVSSYPQCFISVPLMVAGLIFQHGISALSLKNAISGSTFANRTSGRDRSCV